MVAVRMGNRPGSTVRRADEPAPTLIFGARLNDVRLIVGEDEVDQALAHYRGLDELVVRTGNFTAVARDLDGERSAAGSVPYERPVLEPAPTVNGAAGRWTVGPRDTPDEIDSA